MTTTITLLFVLWLGSLCHQLFSQQTQERGTQSQLNQLIATKGNDLEIITYLEGRGRIEGTLGASVGGIGDINQDGYDDVIIGKPGKGAGEALILFGSAEMDSIPDIVLQGENEGDGFGGTVSAGGDINGDGGADFIIAAPGYPSRNAQGRVYVYFGGTSLDTIPDGIFTGENNHDNFGSRVTTGDIDKNELDDILISTVNYSSNGCQVCGKTYLYLGGNELSVSPIWTNQGDTSRSYFGTDLSISDFNGDGEKDILINSAPNGSGRDAYTATELFVKSVVLDTINDFVIIDTSFGDLRDEILISKDINRDGFDDFVIRMGLQFNIYHGGSSLDTIPDAYLKAWHGAGINRLANAGDVNGDGYPDVLAGAWNYFFQSGSVGLYLGSQQINPEVDWTAGGAGFSIDGAGDVNGDGYDDLIISHISLVTTNVALGVVWILAGRPDLEDIGTAVESQPNNIPPSEHHLLPNYPNPFNGETTFRVQLANKLPKTVELVIYDINGKEMIRLIDQPLSAGEYQITWNGKNKYGKEVRSGIYIYRLSIGQTHQIRKLVLVR